MADHLLYLKKAAKNGKLSHAYLLSGNDILEKERIIKGLLSFFTGSNNTKAHSDILFVTPEKNEITIGQIRKLKKELSLSAWALPYKIAVIRCADQMNQAAQSAFLKLLEEPKGDRLLLLEVEHSSFLLDTIRSRVQDLHFYRFLKVDTPKTDLLLKLKKASFAQRFAFAERESQDPKVLYQTFVGILNELRLLFLEELKTEKTDLFKTLRIFQQVLSQLRQTEVNAKYAAERILLEL